MDFMDFPSGSLLIILIIRVYFILPTYNLYNPYNPCLFFHNYNLYPYNPCFYLVANRRRTAQ